MKIQNLYKLDKKHYNLAHLRGYNKPFNFIISGRGSGKSTAGYFMLFDNFMKGTPFIVFRRLKVHINEEYINSILGVINKFLIGEPLYFFYKKGSITTGEVDIYASFKPNPKANEKRLFCRLLALSCDLNMIKSYYIKNAGGILFDEFICSLKNGEKYLKNEFFKFQEIYTTYSRESDSVLKCYFLGNPYSLFNPYFMGLKIPPKNVKKGEIYSPKNSNFAVDYYEIKGKLKQEIKDKNPLLANESYSDYALEGNAVDDRNIKIVSAQPNGFKLSTVYFIENQNIGVFEGVGKDFDYWVQFIDVSKIRRKVFAFDIKDLSTNRRVLSLLDLRNSRYLANAMRMRRVAFKDIESYYYFLEIYKFL